MDTKIDLRAMQQRVDDLGARIRTLSQRIKTGTDPVETARREQLALLDQRHRELGEALAKFHGDKAPPDHHAVVHKLANDLDAALGNFTDWVDAEDHPAPPPGGFSP